MSSCLLSRLKQIAKGFEIGGGFDSVLSKIRLIAVTEGKVSCELKIDSEHVNAAGTLHGGLTATIVDSVSTFALLSANCPPGVSTDLNVSYMRAVPLGQTIVINAECLKIGRTLVFSTVDLIDKDSGKLVAQGRHTKFIA